MEGSIVQWTLFGEQLLKAASLTEKQFHNFKIQKEREIM